MPRSSVLNIAILGPGRIADTQLGPAICAVDEARLWSVLSRDPERGRVFAERHKAAAPQPAYTRLEELLVDSALDAVLICTPDRMHAIQGITAARAGKHVLVEKPMAAGVEEAQAMIETCRQNNVRLGVGYHLRWHAGLRSLVGAIANGALGEIFHMRVFWSFLAPDSSNWRASPELGRWWSLAAVGTHCLDLIRWIMVPRCGEVVRLRSVIAREHWKGPHDETAMVAMQFESGATAEFTTSVLIDASTRVEIYGAKAHAVCDRVLGVAGAGEIHIGDVELGYTPVNPYAGEIADFAAAIRDGREPEVSGREGLRNLELLIEAGT